MFAKMFFKVLFLFFSCVNVTGAEFDDMNCEMDGALGKCMDLKQCPSAIKDIRLRIRPKICRFNQTSVEPIVCCVDFTIKSSPVTQSSTEGNIAADDQNRSEDEGCPPLDERYVPKPKKIEQGHTAWAKCVEYQETAVFPCTKTKRLDYCPPHNIKNQLAGGGGVDAEVGEFPHMALLGYGSSPEGAQWLCGGSLISDRFILTAAHCTSTSKLEDVAYAAMGVLERSESLDIWDIYSIKSIVKHPEYQSPIKYNDIALLQTDRTVKFTDLVFPACLHVGDEVKNNRASATGWGTKGYSHSELADIMQDIPLWSVSDANCSRHFFPHRTLPKGYDNITQMCYGDDGIPRDTCRGDSGGPLQIKSPDIYCTFVIIGVTSFGNVKCASVGYPGIYTRVAHYVPWIESVVWP